MKYVWDEYREDPQKLALKNILWLILLIVGSISIGYLICEYGPDSNRSWHNQSNSERLL